MASVTSHALAPLTMFTVFFALWTGWLSVPGTLPEIAFWWCVGIAAIGWICMSFAPYHDGLATTGAAVTQGAGLLGTVYGFMLLLEAHGEAVQEVEGIATALTTTFVGLSFAIALTFQEWLDR